MNAIEMTRKTTSFPWPKFRRSTWREGWYVQGGVNAFGASVMSIVGPGSPTGEVSWTFSWTIEDVLAEDWVEL